MIIKLQSPISFKKEERNSLFNTVTSAGQWLVDWLGIQSKAGEVVSEQTALRLTAVAACIRIISTNIAKVPKQLYLESNNGDLTPDKRHPLYFQLTEQPCELYNKFQFDRQLLMYRLAWGNAYAYIHRDPTMKPTHRTILYPWCVVEVEQDGKLFYQVNDARYPEIPKIVPARDMYHIRNMSVDGYKGLSPIKLHAETIGVSIASEKYGAKFFSNSGIPSGFIKVPTNVNQSQVQQIKSSWMNQSGGDQSQGIAVLGAGAEFMRLMIPPEEAQFLETRKYGVREIAAIYGVPLHMLADLERATFSNIEHQSIQFVSQTLTDYTAEIEWEDECKLLTTSDRLTHEVRYDYTDLLKGDSNSQADFVNKLINTGVLTINEARKKFGWNSIENGDERFVNSGMQPLNKVIQQSNGEE